LENAEVKFAIGDKCLHVGTVGSVAVLWWLLSTQLAAVIGDRSGRAGDEVA
jgi:hypothetical protein